MKDSSPSENIDFWISEIIKNTGKFIHEFSSFTEKELLYKPSKDTWSIAENIQHLIEVNTSYFPIFSKLLANTYQPPWSGNFSFIYRLLGKTILKSVSEDRKKKIKTFPLWRPDKNTLTFNILSRFESHQEELVAWLEKLEPFIGKKTVINSPANRIISYTLDDAFEIIIRHEKRHLRQAIEVKEVIKNKSAPI